MNGERLSAKELDNFVQVQKNFYYDMYFDKNTNTFAPRQIKNAEFVLVPQFIKGTQLEQVYNMMKENGIDQLNTEETSKAGKARVLSLFDEKTGELTQKNIDDFNAHAKDYIEEYDYNHLYTQQETPQHLDAENKAGIQILKKMIDNIVDGTLLAATRDDFFNNYEANIYESFEDICREINIPLDKNGNKIPVSKYMPMNRFVVGAWYNDPNGLDLRAEYGFMKSDKGGDTYVDEQGAYVLAGYHAGKFLPIVRWDMYKDDVNKTSAGCNYNRILVGCTYQLFKNVKIQLNYGHFMYSDDVKNAGGLEKSEQVQLMGLFKF